MLGEVGGRTTSNEIELEPPRTKSNFVERNRTTSNEIENLRGGSTPTTPKSSEVEPPRTIFEIVRGGRRTTSPVCTFHLNNLSTSNVRFGSRWFDTHLEEKSSLKFAQILISWPKIVLAYIFWSEKKFTTTPPATNTMHPAPHHAVHAPT